MKWNWLLAGMCMWTTTALLAHEGYRVQKDGDRAGRVRLLNQNLETLNLRRSGTTDWTPAAIQNGIDTITFAKMQADGVPINALCDDGTFLRRVSLVLTGRLPDPADTRAFLASGAADKRDAYIEQVLNSSAFRTRWAFWFQEYFASTPFLLRGGHSLYNGFFANAVANNTHLDDMSRALLTQLGLTDQVPEANYYAAAGANTRLPQDFWDNAMIFTSSKLLGVPLECIGCHDGANHLENINLYLSAKERKELWEMSAWLTVIRRGPGTRDSNNLVTSLNISKQASNGYSAVTDAGDRPIRDGGLITPRYIFDGSVPAAGSDWLAEISNRLTADRQFARNWANRLWGHAFGLAMVEPMDGFDLARLDPNATLPEGWELQVFDPALLEFMTDKLIQQDFDLVAYLRYMLQSATFQMSSEFLPGNWQESYSPYYTRYLAHRMTSEEVYDSVVVSTGVITSIPQVYVGGIVAPRANYAHELIDNQQPRRAGTESIRTFLDAFGRGNRYDQPRTNQGGIGQALLLMNSPVTNPANLLTVGRVRTYLNQGLSDSDLITELYLDFYARQPTQNERDTMLAQLAQFTTRQERAQTAVWLLLNQVAFTYIY